MEQKPNKTCLTFTLFDCQFIDEFYDIIVKIFQDKLKYNIEKIIVGKHSNAKREHYHLAFLVSYSTSSLKHLNRKLTPLINNNDRHVDFKISFYHNDDPKYDEVKPFMYPLKESKNKEQNQTLFSKYSYNILPSEFEQWSITAIGIYDKLCYDLNTKKEQQLQKEDTTKAKYKYIDKELFNILDYDADTIYPLGDFMSKNIEQKLKEICKILLRYQKLQFQTSDKLVFKITSIMDLAISYLYFRNLVTEDELIEYKYKI